MRVLVALSLTILLPTSVFAQEQAGLLHEAVTREATKLAATVQTPAPAPQTPAPQEKNWIARHPALTGALIGLGIGFPIGVATCGYPTAEGSSCSDYTYPGNARMLGGLTIGGFGAAIGAGVGALVGAIAR